MAIRDALLASVGKKVVSRTGSYESFTVRQRYKSAAGITYIRRYIY